MQKVKVEDIIYFESEKRIVKLHTKSDVYIVYKKLDEIEEQMEKLFLRCHQSYLVNMREISTITSLQLDLLTGNALPVRRAILKQANEKFVNHICKFLTQSKNRNHIF